MRLRSNRRGKNTTMRRNPFGTLCPHDLGALETSHASVFRPRVTEVQRRKVSARSTEFSLKFEPHHNSIGPLEIISCKQTINPLQGDDIRDDERSGLRSDGLDDCTPRRRPRLPHDAKIPQLGCARGYKLVQSGRGLGLSAPRVLLPLSQQFRWSVRENKYKLVRERCLARPVRRQDELSTTGGWSRIYIAAGGGFAI